MLLVQYPDLLKDAQKRALAAAAEISSAEPLPEAIHSDVPLDRSKSDIYGAYPPGLNAWERPFAEYLDADDTATVLWWHRNPSRKPWSINVLMENGQASNPISSSALKAGRKKTTAYWSTRNTPSKHGRNCRIC